MQNVLSSHFWYKSFRQFLKVNRNSLINSQLEKKVTNDFDIALIANKSKQPFLKITEDLKELFIIRFVYSLRKNAFNPIFRTKL